MESKGDTTYEEVANELIADLAAEVAAGLIEQQHDEKNIRRRVYDALNVLEAIGMITKNKKAIRWRGWPTVRALSCGAAPHGTACGRFSVALPAGSAGAAPSNVAASAGKTSQHTLSEACLPALRVVCRAWGAARRIECRRSWARQLSGCRPSASRCRWGPSAHTPACGIVAAFGSVAASACHCCSAFAELCVAWENPPTHAAPHLPHPRAPACPGLPLPACLQDSVHKAYCLSNLVLRNREAPLPLLLEMQGAGMAVPNPLALPFMLIKVCSAAAACAAAPNTCLAAALAMHGAAAAAAAAAWVHQHDSLTCVCAALALHGTAAG